MRVIYSPFQDGATNMATDQAIMEAVGEGRVSPTLRLYGWLPACLSLGYMQSLRDIDLDRLKAKGWTLVRRPTGGRAILHVDELTYSISLPQDHALVQGDIVTSYRRLSDALQAALKSLGLEPEADKRLKAAVTAICFETPADYEITIEGRKLIGSAQVRKHKAVLQHGSIPLYGDISRICEALIYPDAASRDRAKMQVRQRATTIEAALGRRVEWKTAAHAVVNAFADVFQIAYTQGELTPEESIRLEHLRYETYGSDAWTYKR